MGINHDLFHRHAGRSSAIRAIGASIFAFALYPPFYGLIAYDVLRNGVGLSNGPEIWPGFLFIGSIAGIIFTYKLGAAGIRNVDIEDREIARIALVFGLMPILGVGFWLLFIAPFLEIGKG